MGGIRVFILRKDFTIARKKIRSKESHIHYGKGSYFNKGDAILKTKNKKDPPVLIFQEGNAIPEDGTPKSVVKDNPTTNDPQSISVSHPLESIKWEAWYIPMLRGLNKERHGRSDLNFGRFFNLKTLPFWVIGLALLIQYLGPMLNPAVLPTPIPTPPPMP